MTHAVTQVLNAAKTAVTGLSLTGSNVFLERPTEHALAETELPAIRIYDVSEAADTFANDVLQRNVQINVEAVNKLKLASSPHSSTREIAAQVEAALGVHLTVGGTAQVRLFYRGAEMIDSAEGDQAVVVRRLRFEATIYTTATAPDTLLS